MKCTIKYKGQEYTEKELIEVLSQEPDVLEKYTKQIGRFGKTDIEDSDEKSLDVTLNEIFNSVLNFHNYTTPKSKVAKAKEKASAKEKNAVGDMTTHQIAKALKEEMEKYNDVSQLKSLYAYVNFAEKSLKKQVSFVDKMRREKKLTPDKIKEFKFNIGVFNMLPDVKSLLIKEFNKANLTEEQKKSKKNKLARLDKITADLDTFNKEILEVEREMFAEFMADYSNEHISNNREKYSNQFDVINPTGISKMEWVNAKMEENKDKIREDAIEAYTKQAKKSFGDISAISGMIISEKNLNHGELQIASRMITHADQQVDIFVQSKASEFDKAFKEFSSRRTDSNVENKYKKLLDQTDNGTYLINKYKATFLEAMNESVSWLNPDVYNEKFKDVTVSGNDYTFDGITRPLKLEGDDVTVKGEHVEYVDKKGNLHSISLTDAIARSEKAYWNKENLRKFQDRFGWHTVPKDQWLNEDYNKLSEEDLIDIENLTEYVNEAEALFEGNKSLKEHSASQVFVRMPGITKSSMSRVLSGDILSAMKDKLTSAYKVKEDEFEIEAEGERHSVRKMADLANREMFEMQVPFRAKLNKKEQSLDIHTILLMNLKEAKNYAEKKKLESQLNVMIDVMSNRLVPNRTGLQRLKTLHGFSKDKDIELHYPKDKLPNDVKKLIDIMENRIYGLKEKDAGSIAGKNIQKSTSTLLKYSGSVALIFNWMNSVVNAGTGHINNFIEAWGGEVYNTTDWKAAGRKYWNDVGNIVKDMGAHVDKSKTNMLLNLFNVLGSREALNNNFEDNTKLKTLMKVSNLRPIAQGGEHMMQAKVMYAVLNSIKVQNKAGQMLDKKGKVTTDKKKAATLDEVIEFHNSDGTIEMRMPKWVEATSFSPDPKDQSYILSDTHGLIKKKIIDLHGLHDNDIKNSMQREWYGKLLFFLKKWMVSTTLRRWRGLEHIGKSSSELTRAERYYSEDTKSYQEGYYVTAARFFGHTLIKAMKELKFEIITADFNKMSKHEKANMKRMTAEIGMITLTILGYAAMGGFDDEPDEDTLLARYLLRREMAELSFYMNPAETIKLMKNPTASVSVIERSLKVVGQLMSPAEVYEQGVNKGRLKLWVKTKKVLPIGAQTEKDLKASLRFLQVME